MKEVLLIVWKERHGGTGPLQDLPEVFCQLVDRTKNIISLASIENSLDLYLLVMQTPARKQSGSVFWDVKIMVLMYWFSKELQASVLKLCLCWSSRLCLYFEVALQLPSLHCLMSFPSFTPLCRNSLRGGVVKSTPSVWVKLRETNVVSVLWWPWVALMPKAPPARSAVVGQSSVGLPLDFAACAEFKAAVAIPNWNLSTCPDVTAVLRKKWQYNVCSCPFLPPDRASGCILPLAVMFQEQSQLSPLRISGKV